MRATSEQILVLFHKSESNKDLTHRNATTCRGKICILRSLHSRGPLSRVSGTGDLVNFLRLRRPLLFGVRLMLREIVSLWEVAVQKSFE